MIVAGGVVAAVGGAALAGDSAPGLSGTWVLQTVDGTLPEQMTQALDGHLPMAAGARLAVERSEGVVTARRDGEATPLWRVVMLDGTETRHRVPGGSELTSRSWWRDAELVSEGTVRVTRGFLKRAVMFKEHWRLEDEGRRLVVAVTLQTPLGVRQRTLVFGRVLGGAAAGKASLLRRSGTVRPAGPPFFLPGVNADSLQGRTPLAPEGAQLIGSAER